MPERATLNDRVVREAMEWIGTPVVHQASLKQVGCDCKGLVAGVARELGLEEAEGFYARISHYDRRVDERLLKRGLAETFDPVSEPKAGDVLLMRFGGAAQHLGIRTADGVVHAYAGGTRRLSRVVETPLAVAERAWPIESAWRWRRQDRELDR